MSPSTALVADPTFTSPSINTGQNGGFFTSVSSRGTASGSAVIWAVNRPFDATNDVTLFAFDGASGAQLYSATAGTWPNTGGDSNLVPTVANGKVYVASYRSLSIFGIAGTGSPVIKPQDFVRPPPSPEQVRAEPEVIRAYLGETDRAAAA